MDRSGFFIAGTDTDIGKTVVSVALMQALQQRDLIVNAMKPIAAGCVNENGQLVNQDAQRLQAQCSSNLAMSAINTYAFEPAIAPHIAARDAQVTFDLDHIVSAFDELRRQSDLVIVEGIGGWCVPLDEKQTTVTLAQALNLPVILVVGMRLGCLNHALLTYDAITRANMDCVAWVANQVDPIMERAFDNLQALQQRLQCPCLAAIPYTEKPEQTDLSAHFAVDLLLSHPNG